MCMGVYMLGTKSCFKFWKNAGINIIMILRLVMKAMRKFKKIMWSSCLNPMIRAGVYICEYSGSGDEF